MFTKSRLLALVSGAIFISALACGDSPEVDPVDPVESCGTRGTGPCSDADQACYFPAGQCGRLDKGGTCATPPTACTKEYAPVCGCDGNTYGNDCMARAAGASVDHAGACAPQACKEEDCGPIPPIAPPPVCPDGSVVDVSMTCESSGNNTCGWHVEYGQCPQPECKQEDCGPVPPVAPPRVCDDGSTAQGGSITCERNAQAQCNWNIVAPQCP